MTDPIFSSSPIQHFRNPKAEIRIDWPTELNEVMSPVSLTRAVDEIQQWPSYAATPLHSFDDLATKLGIDAVFYKDESTRFGLGSFKALGGAYAVLCLLQRELSKTAQREISFEEIRNGQHAGLAKQITVASATDGNHGRSVAWGAQLFGCSCVIYIHTEVSEGRKTAIEKFGATVTRVNGNYDASVHQVARDSETRGWFIVSDTSYEGYTELPKHVAAGYTIFMDEAMQAMPASTDGGPPVTHVFVQGGVGGLASAVFGYLWQMFGVNRPRFIVVEPDLAACLYHSAVNGRATAIDITEETIMAGLSCGEVSYLAWKILAQCVDDFTTITDELVGPTMRMLADGIEGATPVVAGESAVAGLAALIATQSNSTLAKKLGLDSNSRVLLIGTEGATDPDIYQQIVGRPSE